MHLVSGCSTEERPPDPVVANGKILFIGVDGLEWNVVLPLLKQGRMPHLAELMSRGVFGQLETYAPATSPVIWTTIASGKAPDKHGITDFIKVVQGMGAELFTSRDRKCKAIWNILSDFGLKSTVIGWWLTFPVDYDVKGVMVAQANTMAEYVKHLVAKGGLLRGVPGQVLPGSRQDEMLQVFEDVNSQLPELTARVYGEIGDLPLGPDRHNWDQCKWAFRADEAYRRIALKLAREAPPPDFFAVYFGMPDVAGHRFWRYYEPSAFKYPPTPEAAKRFGGIIPDSYAHADEIIGELVAAFPKGTDILVISDHGMHAENTQLPVDTSRPRLRRTKESGGHTDGPPGLFVAAGPSFKRAGLAGKSLKSLDRKDLPVIGAMRDVAPTLLALLEIPIGKDMDGKVLKELLADERAAGLRIRYVDTHETPQWLTLRSQPVEEKPGQEERIEQLKALGYISNDGKQSSSPYSTTSGPTSRP
jgi:predicted AlkP superfamily pyrophosphatase or phosphodiesterase